MKKHLFLFCFPIFLFSQSLSKESSIRVYYYPGYWAEGLTYMTYEKDTLIHNSKVSMYNLSRYWAGRQNGLYEYSKIGVIFLLDSAGSVSQLFPELSQYNGKFIDYNLLTGVTLLINRPWRQDPVISLEINNNFTTQFNGISVQGWEVKIKNLDRGSSRIDTLYDHIAFIKDFILPWDDYDRSADGGMGGPLVCYYDKVLGNVNFMGNGTFNGRSCKEILNSVKTNNPLIESLNIFPNPSSDWIEVSSDHAIDLHIYDLNGIQFLKRKIGEGTTKINLETLEPGMYLVNANGLYVQKLIKI